MAFHGGPSYSEDENADLAEINVIPLVDIMLVLLIIFMVTAPLSISGIHVDLPVSKAKGVAIEEQKIILTIDNNGKFFIDKQEIDANQLTAKLQGIYNFKSQRELYIRADKKVAYGQVVLGMSAAKSAGVSKIAMLTTAPTKPAAEPQ